MLADRAMSLSHHGLSDGVNSRFHSAEPRLLTKIDASGITLYNVTTLAAHGRRSVVAATRRGYA